MRRFIISMSSALIFVMVLSIISTPAAASGAGNMTDISITVNRSVFSAKLYDNSAAKALLALLPMTLDMSDLNGNEKYYNLSETLPSESTERPATIHAGDIMCWSGNALVLFYETFSNSYGGYVRLGYVEDASGFAAALGNGGVQVSLAIDATEPNAWAMCRIRPRTPRRHEPTCGWPWQNRNPY